MPQEIINPKYYIKEMPYFGVTYSPNKKYLALTLKSDKTKLEKYKTFVFDENFNKVFNSTYNSKTKNKSAYLESIEVSNEDGSVYILNHVYDKKQKLKISYRLTKLNGDGSKSLKINSSSKYINDIKSVVNHDQPFCIGLYSEKGTNKSKGFSYFKINTENMTLISSDYIPFSDQLMNDKFSKKKKKELKYLTLKKVHIDNEKNIYITVEEIQEKTNAQSFSGTLLLHDIICAKLNMEGKLLWSRNINKKQQTTYYSGSSFDPSGLMSTYGSFVSKIINNQLYLFLNSGVKTLKDNKIEFKDGKKLYAIKFDDKGNYIYKSIKTSEPPILTSNNQIVKDNTSIKFVAHRKRKLQIVKINW